MKYIKSNLKYITIALLTSVAVSFLLFPIILEVPFIKNFILNPDIYDLIGFTVVYILLILLFFDNIYLIIKRYKNNLFLKNKTFSYVDFFIWFSSSLLVMGIIVNQRSLITTFNFSWFLLVNLFITIFILLIVILKSRDKSITKILKNVDKLSDNPINYLDQDLLDRIDFVDSFVNELKSLQLYEEYSYVFGLYGSWGEGKTSFMNFVKEKMHKDPSYLIIDFNPWHYKDKQAIINAFFTEIHKKINEQFIFSDFKNYIKKYVKLISFGFIKVDFKIDASTESESFNNIKDNIQKHLNCLNKNIIIIIDDLDRLELDEIMLIYKLVALNANFKNICFILCFDPIIIQQYLIKNNIEKHYIEKIINKSFTLPLPPQSELDKVLLFGIKDILEINKFSENVIQTFFKEFSYKYNIKIRERFKTLRNIKTFLNSFKLDLPLVAKEVNVMDFSILTMIKLFYPLIYNNIIANPALFISVPFSSQFSHRDLFTSHRKDDKNERVKNNVENIIKEEVNIDLIKYMLCSLFPKIGEMYNAIATERHDGKEIQRYEKRICNYESFIKYFHFKVPEGEISDAYLEDLINVWNKDNNEKAVLDSLQTLKSENKLDELLRKILVFNQSISDKTVKIIILVLYKSINIFSKKRDEEVFFGFSEYEKAYDAMMKLITDRLKHEEIEGVLVDIIENTSNMPLIVNIAFTCIKEKSDFYNIHNNIDKQKIVAISLKRLRKYFLEENHNIFQEFKEDIHLTFILYQWATNWGIADKNNFTEVNNYIISLVKANVGYLIDLIEKFSKSEPTNENENRRVFRIYDLSEMCDIKELEKISTEYVENKSIAKSYKAILFEFLDACKLYFNKLSSQNK